jgi:hypothetical protein
VAEADEIERLGHAGVALGTRRAPQLQAVGDVLGDRHVREQRIRLEDHAEPALLGCRAGHVRAVDEDPPGRRAGVAGEHAQRRRLAAPRGTQQGRELAGGDRHVDAVDGGEVAEDLRHVLELSGVHELMPPKILAKPTVRSAMTAMTMVTARMMVEIAATIGS